MRLLVKNLGRGMPESGVREKLESLNIRVQGEHSCSGSHSAAFQLANYDPGRDRPPTPTSLHHWREGLRF